MERETVKHSIDPVFDKNSRVLILGSMPSPKSRETGFYYGNPGNRFWKAIAGVYGEQEPIGPEKRREFVIMHRIALWDVIAECSIIGASDASIRDVKANDLSRILGPSDIQCIFTTGRTAFGYYMEYCYKSTNVSPVYLPSPSGANCANFSLDDLVREYAVIREYTG